MTNKNPARRFFRLHKWIDHFTLATEKFNSTNEENAMLKLLHVTKNGFLGVYFFMEMGTIVSLSPHIPFSSLLVG